MRDSNMRRKSKEFPQLSSDQHLIESIKKGRSLIEDNYKIFNTLLGRAKRKVRIGKYNEAAVYAEIAAYCATWNHSGMFVSREIEELLQTIGRRAIDYDVFSERKILKEILPESILHVATFVGGISGLNRLMWRWIRLDNSRAHSLAISGSGAEGTDVPALLQNSIYESGGKIYKLHKESGNIIERAKKLRGLSKEADLIVLHLQTEDVVPLIAFAGVTNLPPVLFVNNADHNFWIGTSIADIIVNLRNSGKRLSIKRRGVPKEKSCVLPILIPKSKLKTGKIAAKRKLGLNDDCIMLLSIARATKYRTGPNRIHYARAHLPVLMKHNKAVLLVIGPQENEDWKEARIKTNGRIRALGPLFDTDIFYEAADIYVDSFPIVSITSLLEAGSYSIALLSQYPYPEGCGVLGADTVALEESLIRTKSLKEYQAKLSELILKLEMRNEYGKKTKYAIDKTHSSNEFWYNNLMEIYNKALKSKRKMKLNICDEVSFSELDCLIPQIYRTDFKLEQILDAQLNYFGLNERIHIWIKLVLAAPYLFTIPLIAKILTKLGIMKVYYRSSLLQRLKAHLFRCMFVSRSY